MHISTKQYTPQFCFITPIEYLQFATASTTHLVLAHLIDGNEKYATFYKNLASVGDYIIMDNSAYELKEPYSPDKLLELAGKCGARAIVLPDYPFQPSKVTIDAAEKFAPLFKDAGYDTFFVPQSKKGELDDWLEGYKFASTNPSIDIIGMSILGIPNALPNIDPAFSRVVMTQILLERDWFNEEKHHHYLGLNAGPKLEIPSLLRMHALDTIDSSGPVWAGITGHRYTPDADSYQTVSKIKMPVDFHLPLTKDEATLERISHNVKMTTELFYPANYEKDVVWYAQE